jgi:hypothetical protein
MGNSNKYADGLSFVLFPGNHGLGTAGYNFPESTAQDDGGGGGGNISLTFSGTRIPYTSDNPVNYFRGPSGFSARYTTLALMTGGAFQKFYTGANTVPGPVAFSNTFGAPDLRSIYGVSNRAATEAGSTPEDDGTYITERFKNSRAFNSISQVNVLDLICEGPIEGFVSGIYIPDLSGKNIGDIGYNKVTFQLFEQTYSNPETRSIFWNDVPVTDLKGFYNFQFADYKYSYGEKNNDHTVYNPYLNLYEDRRDYFGRQVDQNKIPLQTSITKSINDTLYGFYLISGNNQIISPKTYYIYNTEISSIKVNFKVNSLFEQILTGANAGDVERQLQTFRIIISRLLNNNEKVLLDTSKYTPYIKDYFSRDEFLIQGKISNSPVIVPYEITLKPYAENSPWYELFPNQIGWALDIVKMSREGVGGGLVTSTSIDSITETYSDRFVYPDTAMVLSKFDARYFSDIPARSYKVRLLKVKIPINYNPISKTYTGPWNGKFKVAWTDNPAWCFYDLITNNRYGLGKFIDTSLTDKWTLFEIAQYCDELVSDGAGGLEPRFKCNLYIANKEEAYKVLNDMASVFRAIIYYSAGQITVAQDSLKEPIYLFNNSNTIDGAFNYSDASKKSRKTVALVRYNDENDNYKPAIEYIEDKNYILKYGIRETEIVAFGCTNKNQARRVGKWLITTQNSETELIDFKVGLEGHYIKPGDVISVYDQYRKNTSYAGRTVELTTGYAILDLPYDYRNTYAITGVNVNNSFIFNVLTPTYNLNPGTELGDFYITGSNAISSGISGLNSSFFRRSQLQSITINNPQNYLTSGSGIYSNNIRINFPSGLSALNYSLSSNAVWSIDVNTSGYSSAGMNTRSEMNNDLRALYPGYYLEPYLNKPKKYRVLTISENDPELFNITALEYNDQKYYDIDNTALLVNVPVKANPPVAPTVFLSGIFRDPNSNSYLRSPNGTIYTTNQGGINSIMYNIQPPGNNSSNQLYYVYAKPFSDFTSSSQTPEVFLADVISPLIIKTGLTPENWALNYIPPFLTPTGAGIYYFRIFSENSLGERSSPLNASFNLTAQASVFSVQESGRNIY